MNLWRILLLAVVVALGSCSPLLAGPISWSYSSSIGSDGDPSINQVFIRNGGHGAGGSWLLWADFEGQSLTSESDSASVALGSAFPGIGNAATDSPKTFDTNFRVTVTLTDEASGQSGSVSFTGFFTAPDGDNPIDAVNEMVTQFTSPLERSILIGGNRYNVALQDPSGTGPLTADVSVGPAAATPEPASLCLAVAGMGLVFAARRGSLLAKLRRA